MRCPTCPVSAGACLGESAPRLCYLGRTRPEYRQLLIQRAKELAAPPESPPFDLDSALTVISACPHRGPVLPTSLQPECGCSELSECEAGHGRVSGRVALHDCLSCVFERRATRTASG